MLDADRTRYAAQKAAPHAKLVYNDYMGWGPNSAKHREGGHTVGRLCRCREAESSH